MILLIFGLIVFLGVHSVRMLAENKRLTFIEEKGEVAYKLIYAILSLLGLVLLIIGYGQVRASAQFVWHPPTFLNHITALLMIAAFVLLAAAYVPGNRIKAMVGHPMVLGVKIWAFAHLLSNGGLGDIVLFGSFLAWAVANFIISRKRDRLAGEVAVIDTSAGRGIVVALVGVGAWLVFAFWAHTWLIGVSPFGI